MPPGHARTDHWDLDTQTTASPTNPSAVSPPLQPRPTHAQGPRSSMPLNPSPRPSSNRATPHATCDAGVAQRHVGGAAEAVAAACVIALVWGRWALRRCLRLSRNALRPVARWSPRQPHEQHAAQEAARDPSGGLNSTVAPSNLLIRHLMCPICGLPKLAFRLG